MANLLPLSQMDHLLLVTDSGQAVSCLCGDFQVSIYVIFTFQYFSVERKQVYFIYAVNYIERIMSSRLIQSNYYFLKQNHKIQFICMYVCAHARLYICQCVQKQAGVNTGWCM